MKSEIKQLKAGLYVVAAIQLCSIAKAQVDTTVRPLTLNGSATMITLANGNPALRLTPALTNQAGSAFTTSSVTVNKFRVFFQFRITSGPGGYGGYGPGDGMALVLQIMKHGDACARSKNRRRESGVEKNVEPVPRRLDRQHDLLP